MTIAASLLPELDHEMKTTRSLLERVPDARHSWQPHGKSMSMGRLAVHIPELLQLIPLITGQPELDFMAHGPSAQWQSREATLAMFDAAVAEGRAAIAAESDEALMKPWTLRAGSHVIATVPRAAALRSFVLNHVIHHRGQLSVYLRLNDIAVPEIYGPTADSAR